MTRRRLTWLGVGLVLLGVAALGVAYAAQVVASLGALALAVAVNAPAAYYQALVWNSGVVAGVVGPLMAAGVQPPPLIIEIPRLLPIGWMVAGGCLALAMLCLGLAWMKHETKSLVGKAGPRDPLAA